MKQLLPKIAKPSLLGICAILILLILLPTNTALPKAKPAQTEGQPAEMLVTAEILHDSGDLDPGFIAEMFGWIRPTATPTPLPTGIPTKVPAPTCVPAGYLKFITTYRDEQNVKWYIFRDLRNNATIQINQGATVEGWTFVGESDAMFTFRREGVIHCSYK